MPVNQKLLDAKLAQLEHMLRAGDIDHFVVQERLKVDNNTMGDIVRAGIDRGVLISRYVLKGRMIGLKKKKRNVTPRPYATEYRGW